MHLEIIKAEKNDVEFKIDNVTLAEIIRVYLNEQDIEFGAWRREHPFKPLVMKVQSANAKKSISDVCEAIKKDLDKISASIKKK